MTARRVTVLYLSKPRGKPALLLPLPSPATCLSLDPEGPVKRVRGEFMTCLFVAPSAETAQTRELVRAHSGHGICDGEGGITTCICRASLWCAPCTVG